MGEVILYVGGFRLPDKNAAAQRVIANAKALRDCGHEVLFVNYELEKGAAPQWTKYVEFDCFDNPACSMLAKLASIQEAVQVIEERNVTCVIAYNYPAVALNKLIRYCHRKGIRCYADATEWYVPRGNLLFRIIKTLDTEWRMRILHPAMDGVIAISEYLYQYYKGRVHTVKIPPLVDITDEKWNEIAPKEESGTVFVYSGSPDAQKERLDLIVHAVEEVSKNQKVSLKVVGITKEQYEAIYLEKYNGTAVCFMGRIPHKAAIQETKNADWSIIIRENNKVVQAGFPTKIAESIACGTPVIANEFSNIMDYLDETNNICCCFENIKDAILEACNDKRRVSPYLFDYHSYVPVFYNLLR